MPTINTLPNANGTVASWGEGTGGYYGQTFIATGSALTDLQFRFASHSGNTDYKVYIVTWTGTRPGAILWESPLLTVGTGTGQFVSVAVPNLHLDTGTKYAFILDTSVGVLNGGSAGSLAALAPDQPGYAGDYADGEFFFSHFETGTVAGNLALNPIIFAGFDLGFAMNFSDFVNTAPVARPDMASVIENKSVTGNVLANDSDIDPGTQLVVTGLGFGAYAGTVGAALEGRYGILTLNANGTYSYAADSDLLDTLRCVTGLKDVFTYSISDGAGGTASASLTINVGLADDERTTRGGNRDDIIFGDQRGLIGAEDEIYGGNGDDQLHGLRGADELNGGNGDDRLWGYEGRDRLYGDNGDDRLFGGDGRDRLDGDNGNDRLEGGDDEDWLDGGNGNDVLLGGSGNDLLDGGRGNDRLTGGSGADRFLVGRSDGDNVITDFERGVDEIFLDDVRVRSIKFVDVDRDGTLDAVLKLSSGSLTLLGVGSGDLSGDIVSGGSHWPFGGDGGFF